MRASSAVPEGEVQSDGQPLAQVCARVAFELELIRQIGARIEQSLCNAADGWRLDDERARELQHLDHLIQHLSALRDFVSALAHQVKGVSVDPTDALEKILLSALKARLEGVTAPSDVTPEPWSRNSADEVEMF